MITHAYAARSMQHAKRKIRYVHLKANTKVA